MILIINICRHELHYHEFVKPIEDILRSEEIFFVTRHYSEVTSKDFKDSHRVIIPGTSIQDNQYLDELKYFTPLIDYDKPLLGICAGMQVLCRLYGCKLSKGTDAAEIGMTRINFPQEFLGIKGDVDVYCVHSKCIVNDSSLKNNFIICGSNKKVHALRHKHKPHYGILFHPEVRHKGLIKKFLYI